MADGVPPGELQLSGPSPRADPARLPQRADLAHIKLAGRCFVPHFAEPMRLTVGAGGAMLRQGSGEGTAMIAQVAPGTAFDVLDFAGGWAWGQLDEGLDDEGLVGYIAEPALDGRIATRP